MTDIPQTPEEEVPGFEIPVDTALEQPVEGERGLTKVSQPMDDSPFQGTVDALVKDSGAEQTGNIWDNYKATTASVLTDEVYTSAAVTQTDTLRAARRVADQDALSIPMDDKHITKSIMDATPRVGVAGNKETREWGETLSEASVVYLLGQIGDTLARRENADWQQAVANPTGELLRPTRPAINARTGQALTGEAAMMRVRAILGMGSVANIPLWHSGLWISIKAPSDGALLELERRIATNKGELGRTTYGLAYSNSSVYINQALVDFVISHIYDCSLKDWTADALKEVILMNDLPLMIHGLLMVIYPNGYNLNQPCIANIVECRHVVKEMINLSKLCWVDRTALSADQVSHMSRRREKFTVEEMKKYQSLHRISGTELVLGSNGNSSVVATMGVPNIKVYEQTGFTWVNEIQQQVAVSFAELEGQERLNYIQNQARLTSIRQYAHWFTKLTLVNGQGDAEYIEDRATIDQVIGDLSSEQQIVEKAIDGISKFIDNMTIAFIGVPNFRCPACGKKQADDNEKRHPNLIPLDVGQVFFTLRYQRLQKAMAMAYLV